MDASGITSSPLPTGINQGTGTEVTLSGKLDPNKLDQAAPEVSSQQPVENDLDHIPDLPG